MYSSLIRSIRVVERCLKGIGRDEFSFLTNFDAWLSNEVAVLGSPLMAELPGIDRISPNLCIAPFIWSIDLVDFSKGKIIFSFFNLH